MGIATVLCAFSAIAATVDLHLHEQRLASKSVQHHIADSGGHSERVTLVGFSAGSRSIEAKIISIAGKGNLFQARSMQDSG